MQIDWKTITVALGIPAVGGLITYFLYKKGSESGGLLRNDFCRIEITVRGDKVGAVIGQKGSVVREIEQTTGASVRVKAAPLPPLNSTVEEQDGSVIIQGLRDNVTMADIAVRKVIAQTPPVMTQIVYVPKSAIGLIIGKKGANIQELCRLSGSRVTIGQSGKDMEMVIIKGRPNTIDAAKMWLENKLKTSQELRERYGDSKKRPLSQAQIVQ